MVDISLSLLIMFVLAIPYIIESGLFVSRAAVSKGQSNVSVEQPKKDVKANIYLQADGTILLNNESISEDRLREVLPQLMIRSISQKVLLSADLEVIYNDVIRIIDLSKQCGAADVLIVKRRNA
jgi:biopolymer transport protein ExbD